MIERKKILAAGLVFSVYFVLSILFLKTHFSDWRYYVLCITLAFLLTRLSFNIRKIVTGFKGSPKK